jgi:hypothetical protein
MDKNSRPRLLEVRVIPLKPDQWEWQVCEGDKAILTGYESSRETAQIEGDSALFMLLSTGDDASQTPSGEHFANCGGLNYGSKVGQYRILRAWRLRRHLPA